MVYLIQQCSSNGYWFTVYETETKSSAEELEKKLKKERGNCQTRIVEQK